MRIMKLRKRQLKLRDKVKTKSQLVSIKKVSLPLFKIMGLSRNKIRNINIRFGQSFEIDKNSTACLSINKEKDEILIKRGLRVVDVIISIAHEIGHKVTIFGKFSIIPLINIRVTNPIHSFNIIMGTRRKNILGEISAYNFQTQFNKHFCYVKNVKIYQKNGNFWESIKSSPVHYISRILKFIPLGSLIKNEYK